MGKEGRRCCFGLTPWTPTPAFLPAEVGDYAPAQARKSRCSRCLMPAAPPERWRRGRATEGSRGPSSRGEQRMRKSAVKPHEGRITWNYTGHHGLRTFACGLSMFIIEALSILRSGFMAYGVEGIRGVSMISRRDQPRTHGSEGTSWPKTLDSLDAASAKA